MNLSESVGFFGEASSKIINTAMLGELKLEIIFTSKKWTKLHFKSPTAERRHASCVGGWRGSNPRRPAPMEQGMPALTSRLLRARDRYQRGRSRCSAAAPLEKDPVGGQDVRMKSRPQVEEDDSDSDCSENSRPFSTR